jgi:hypothetical protein
MGVEDPDNLRGRFFSAAAEGTGSGLGLAVSMGEIDGLGSGFDPIMVALPYLVEDVAHLLHPATLVSARG